MQGLFDDDPKPVAKKSATGKVIAILVLVLVLGYFLLKALKVL